MAASIIGVIIHSAVYTSIVMFQNVAAHADIRSCNKFFVRWHDGTYIQFLAKCDGLLITACLKLGCFFHVKLEADKSVAIKTLLV